MEPPSPGKSENGFDNSRTARTKMRYAYLKRFAVEDNQAGTFCCPAGTISCKKPTIQTSAGKSGVVGSEILKFPVKSRGKERFSLFKIGGWKFNIINLMVVRHTEMVGAVTNASKRARKKEALSRLFNLP